MGLDRKKYPEASYPTVPDDGPPKAGEPLRNERARSEIHESAREHLRRDDITVTAEQVDRWREDLGGEAVDKLLEEFPK